MQISIILQANAAYLEKKFESLPIKDLNFLTNELNQLFLKCCEYVLSENIIRMINALQVSLLNSFISKASVNLLF